MTLSQRLIRWYDFNKRELPWRETSDPYKIWISEIILQQTRVNQGRAYYERFIRRFPDIITLSKAEENEVLKLWQGLGYYSRARNLHASAKIIAMSYNGVFPAKYKDVLNLKGIGEYTAAAICSFAYNSPYAVVDGNVFRVLSRVFGIYTPIDSGKGKKEITELAFELLDKENPGLHNQAVMDLGATVCTPQTPGCEECPLQDKCFAYEHKRWNDFPVKTQKIKQRIRYFYYFYITTPNGKIYLQKREKNDIWKNLYELPLIETDRLLTPEELIKEKNYELLKKRFNDIQVIKIHPTVKHILSHQHIYATFIEAKTKGLNQKDSLYLEIDTPEVGEYPVSRLTDIFLSRREKP